MNPAIIQILNLMKGATAEQSTLAIKIVSIAQQEISRLELELAMGSSGSSLDVCQDGYKECPGRKVDGQNDECLACIGIIPDGPRDTHCGGFKECNNKVYDPSDSRCNKCMEMCDTDHDELF